MHDYHGAHARKEVEDTIRLIKVHTHIYIGFSVILTQQEEIKEN
jgi:hypothetical protein